MSALADYRQSEMKGCPLACLGYDPDSSTMTFNNFFAYRETDAGSRIFVSSVQALKNDKDSLGILGV